MGLRGVRAGQMAWIVVERDGKKEKVTFVAE
jgi:hypothetical protein